MSRYLQIWSARFDDKKKLFLILLVIYIIAGSLYVIKQLNQWPIIDPDTSTYIKIANQILNFQLPFLGNDRPVIHSF